MQILQGGAPPAKIKGKAFCSMPQVQKQISSKGLK
jgi:hypothetical protein